MNNVVRNLAERIQRVILIVDGATFVRLGISGIFARKNVVTIVMLVTCVTK